MDSTEHFSRLSTETVLDIVEATLSVELTPFVQTLPSYINRVYEVRDHDDTAYIIKFYRPNRWTMEAILDEHQFLMECEEYDLPVVAPLRADDGTTLYEYEEIYFALFPRKAGRDFELYEEENWIRLGSLLGRLHNVGAQQKAENRLTLTPHLTTSLYIDELLPHVTPNLREAYRSIGNRIVDTITPYFEDADQIRIHGDFHMGNILHRPGEGILLIDFDDMMNGPAVQDFWLLLPDHYPASREQLQLLMLGYSDFRHVNPNSPLLIEGLRAMRMIYFTAWSAMQRKDPQFQSNFPHWGEEGFWSREIADLQQQYGHIAESLRDQF